MTNSVLAITLIAFIAVVYSLPTQSETQPQQQPIQQEQPQELSEHNNFGDSREQVPSEAEPKVQAKPIVMIKNDGDDYDLLHSHWVEPKIPLKDQAKPQTGSLIQLDAAQVDLADVLPKSPDVVSQLAAANEAPKSVVKDMVSSSEAPEPNGVNDHYPIIKDGAITDIKESSQKIAPPPTTDPEHKDVHGVYGDPVVFDRPENPHPMEAKTPLIDPAPCDPERILNVRLPAAQLQQYAYPVLPARYGCGTAKDSSREKVSPAVKWDNVAEDTVDFSLQLIEMGDNCEPTGPNYGRILWHITGIKAAHEITLDEGASHDKRMIFGGVEQPNQWLEEYYSGPCPDAGTIGCYRMKVLAHRANGKCQCGHQDFFFARPAAEKQQ